MWQACIAALSAAVRREDCHVIDVTALLFSLPSLPVTRGVFFLPKAILFFALIYWICLRLAFTFLWTGELRSVWENGCYKPTMSIVGRLAWLSESLHCNSGTRHSSLATARTQVLFLETGFSFVLYSDKFGFNVSYCNRKIRYKIHAMLQVWIASLVLWKTGVISWFGSIRSAVYFRIFTQYAHTSLQPVSFCWFLSSSPETEQEQMQQLWSGVNDKPSWIPYISPLLMYYQLQDP